MARLNTNIVIAKIGKTVVGKGEIETWINTFYPNVPFLYPLKTSGNVWKGFLIYSESVEMENWTKMGKTQKFLE